MRTTALAAGAAILLSLAMLHQDENGHYARIAPKFAWMPKHASLESQASPPARPRVSLFGSPRLLDGTCPSTFRLVPQAGALCYRACKQDADCPQGSSCQETHEALLCRAD